MQFVSFYVALTRVRNGQQVFLKSYDRSYIVENNNIKTKLAAFRKFNSYKPKKVYLDEQIFQDQNLESKIGYLNINGIIGGNHAEYLNSDRNLMDLDILALAETKLTHEVTDEYLEQTMDNWKIIKRYDAEDKKPHMGLILMIPRRKVNTVLPFLHSFEELMLKKNSVIHSQGLKVKFQGDDGLSLGFIYCRESPNVKDCEAIVRKFNSCHFILGDINLSPNSAEEKRKLDLICGENKYLALKEITRLASGNQLDHIIAEKRFSDKCYCSSFLNFISDHKSIVVRFNAGSAGFLPEFLQRETFDEEMHQKKIFHSQNDEPKQTEETDKAKEKKQSQPTSKPKKRRIKERKDNHEQTPKFEDFRRCFRNPDASSCWLNACLQLILSAFDHCPSLPQLQSPLGRELLNLHRSANNLNPTLIKEIVMQQEIKRHQENPSSQFLNLADGQQCTRDFFIALTESIHAWHDVFSMFAFQLVEQTQCGNPECNHINISEQVNVNYHSLI